MQPILRGRGFSEIPDDAIGIGSNSNSDPLRFKDAVVETNLMRITEKNDIELKFTQDAPHGHNNPTYIGAIVSADRQTIYWVNNTQPLP